MRQCRHLSVAGALLAAAIAPAQTPIAEIKVTGASTLPAQAIAAASGLRAGQTVTPQDLDAAMNRLFETGLLASVKYRYDPGPGGLTVTWIVAEDPPTLPVELDIPGFEEDALWAGLTGADALIRRSIPENENATAYYRRAIETLLAKQGKPQTVVGNVEGDLATGNLGMIFRPANAPKISGFRFEGNRALDTAAIEPVIALAASGQAFSERQFRKMLDLNVRPLYEERGYLTVRFTEVALSDGGTVNVRIEEGRQWQLGRVELTGADIPGERMLQAARFPEGQLANWKQVAASIDQAEQVLRAEGYLRVESRALRRFRQDAPIVDLTIEVRKGPQFVFGELRLTGLSDAMRARALSVWKLKPGQPMNEPYVAEFLRTLGDSGIPFQNVNLSVEPRPGTNIADVEIGLK